MREKETESHFEMRGQELLGHLLWDHDYDVRTMTEAERVEVHAFEHRCREKSFKYTAEHAERNAA